MSSVSISTRAPEVTSYLTQREASEIDGILMGPFGFSVDQLMELAGLSVATSIAEVYKPNDYQHVLTICGPGNNGGDGLVAARHLHHFGYGLSICYPKRTPKPLYDGLVTQLESLSIPFISVEDLSFDKMKDFDIIVDAMFGFSFQGVPRPPFDGIIQKLINVHNSCETATKPPAVVSVDIPSGWHVEEGDDGNGIKPDMLVSLTAPKLCAKKFTGAHHFLGGRFVPPSLAEKYRLSLPPYPGTSMCVRLGSTGSDISSLRETYISPEFVEEHVCTDAIDQFCRWFKDAMNAGVKEPNAMCLSTVGLNLQPSSRMVLLKDVNKDGFVWYTNYGSRKACELSENPRACLLFFWQPLHRQVRVEGTVQKISETESESYFRSRPREHQIGASVSKQSTVISSRHVLRQQYKEMEDKLLNVEEIPRPEHWGGYRLKPDRVEFWQGQLSRLHDRLLYTVQETDGKRVWTVSRLAP